MVSNTGLQAQPLTTKRLSHSQMEPSPKGQPVSDESVRSKMRESLASALTSFHDSQTVASPIGAVEANHAQTCLESKSCESVSNLATSNCPIFEASALESSFVVQSNNVDGSLLGVNAVAEKSTAFTKICEDGNHVFVRDELIEGHGLCWESEVNHERFRTCENREFKRAKLCSGETVFHGQDDLTHHSESLASSIEGELFKVFGGVNKKYKEKGRSLLFNLKDPNNPELRERVISGEIPPERLCSMSAEELASKELSQWRIAKAEELAQMVVLPEPEVDVRRLVRKTHKGEIQVEVDRDDSILLGVAVGDGPLSKVPFTGGNTVQKIYQAEIQEIDSGVSRAIAGGDHPDMEMNELKDPYALPPIVSLDEFMSSFDCEATSWKSASVASTDMDANETFGSPAKMDSLICDSKDVLLATQANVSKVTVEGVESSFSLPKISQDLLVARKGVNIDDCIWEGVLQLNMTAMVAAVSFFRSGERTSAVDWPNIVEVKGRVKLDAFGNFLQELPHSRSRAIMVAHFCCNVESPENSRETMAEVANCYSSDQRVGLAEPVPGVEIYFCAYDTKTTELLSKLLTRDESQILDTIDSGLVGIVVWRRAQPISSPKRPSHPKQSSRKEHSSAPKKEKQAVVVPCGRAVIDPPSDADITPDEDDEVPPGFGPPGVREEDDLPEFEFDRRPEAALGVGLMASPVQSHGRCPMEEQMRELVHKYGQKEIGVAMWGPNPVPLSKEIESQGWNQEEDDIPEWQPHQDVRSQAQPVPGPPLPPPPPPPPPPRPSLSQPYQQWEGVGMPRPLPMLLQSGTIHPFQTATPVRYPHPMGSPLPVPGVPVGSCATGIMMRPCHYGNDSTMSAQLFQPNSTDWRPRFR